MMEDYLRNLINWQKGLFNKGLVENELETLYGDKNTDYPEWEFLHFDTKEDLYAWTSADNYTYEGGLKGVCYGFQISQDASS